ncbi:MAG: Holliday junction resolvase Hjc [Nanoarchaeota archaeon]|nr:Holliday junction resolvase Hjc [Nanoarchaeota archaeon]
MVFKSPRQRKAAGTKAENELIHKFWEEGWCCIRVAGSGSTKYPAPDLLAGNSHRKIVFEIKVVSAKKKYFSNQEILDLEYFARTFGAEAWVGVQFETKEWFFCPTSELEKTKSENYVADLIKMKQTGFKFEEMINT